MKTISLSRQGRHGDWEYLGNHASIEEALDIARDWSYDNDTHRDDCGTAIFRLVDDSWDRHETRFEVYEDGSSMITDIDP